MDEIHELDRLRECNEYDLNLDFTSYVSKVIILIQANISRAPLRVSSLISDTQFIMQVRISLLIDFDYFIIRGVKAEELFNILTYCLLV